MTLSRLDFWRGILPSEGLYCVVGISGKKDVTQTFHASLEEADAAVALLDQQGINSFIALANFATGRNRTVANAVSLKCLFLDLDCGADDPKKYPDQVSAVSGLKQFIKATGYPRPAVVSSGYGVHVYWPLTKAAPRLLWKRIADKLKAACIMGGLKIDATVTGDPARVLRAVGTSNWKNPENPVPVEVLATTTPLDVEVFCKLLNVTDTTLDEISINKPLDEVTKALLANTPSSFKLILQKSLKGTGCKQLLDLVENQETASEPMWRSALSIAQFCKDRQKAIHLISSRHPDYSPTATEEKAARIQGPYRCETFWTNNPQGCEGCPHKGKLTSPILLGRGEVETASPEDNVVHVAQALHEEPKQYVIPEFPFPYVRGKHGGIYIKNKDDEEGPLDKLVYENDFYLVNTVDDPNEGMLGLFRLHLPQDGVREFSIPLRDMIAKDIFAKRMAEQGVSTIKDQMNQLRAFSSMSVKTYQRMNKATKSRLQFGWADNFTSFIIGDRQITATGIHYSPPSSSTLSLIRLFRRGGTLENWKKIVSFYNRPGMEMHMFLLFAGFSSPLVPFSNRRRGGILSLYSSTAGSGKSSILLVSNSIYGHPEDLMMIKADTSNALIHRIGILQNITPTIDEITNMSPEHVSDFLYHFLHNRGKNRLVSSVNGERRNYTTWAANCIVTANQAIEDKLFSKKRKPDGELARFLEFAYTPGTASTKEESDRVFDPLNHNYGVAGEPYAQHLVQHVTELEDLLSEMQRSIDRGATLTQRERYWSTMSATILTGGLLAREAKVLDFSNADFKRVYDWTVAMLQERRGATVKESSDPRTALGGFISEHPNDLLIIHSGVTLRTDTGSGTLPPVPIREPRGKLYMRYEPDTKLLYINKPTFRKYCAEGQVAYAEVIQQLRKDGDYVDEKKFRMGKGLHVSEPENVLIVHYNDPEGLLVGNTRNTSKD